MEILGLLIPIELLQKINQILFNKSTFWISQFTQEGGYIELN